MMYYFLVVISLMVVAALAFFLYVIYDVRKTMEEAVRMAEGARKEIGVTIGSTCQVCIMGIYEPADVSCSLCGHSVKIGDKCERFEKDPQRSGKSCR